MTVAKRFIPSNRHTPTPWRFVPETLHEGRHVGGRTPSIVSLSRTIAKMDGFGSESSANAELIVRAVNCHQELLDALHHVLAIDNFHALETVKYGEMPIIEIVKAAIQKAETGG